MLLTYLRRSLLGFMFLLFSIGAFAKPFSQLIVFSGSLTDTGNHASVNGGTLPPPYYKNRISDGPVAVDIIASRLGLSSDPSLHLIGKQAGTNYAVLHASAAGNLPIDMPQQIAAYLGPRHNVADPDALYFVFIGANDIIAASIEQDERKSEAALKNGIKAIDDGVRKLHAAGARIFYAPNNINLGIAPVARSFGISARVTEKTQVFNRMFEKELRKLERELDINIFRFDFYKFGEDMVATLDKTGFTNATDSCLQLLPQGKCDLNRFAFFNDLLPTKRIHELFGNAMVTALIEQLNTPKCSRWHHLCRPSKGERSYFDIDFND
jgi:cholinesterase